MHLGCGARWKAWPDKEEEFSRNSIIKRANFDEVYKKSYAELRPKRFEPRPQNTAYAVYQSQKPPVPEPWQAGHPYRQPSQTILTFIMIYLTMSFDTGA